jgi:RNA polymerase sigma-70 factor (ECF subfamily)
LIKEDGIKYKEVAEILNISPRTVQTQLYRAMKKLSVVLAEYTTSRNTGSKEALLGIVLLLSIAKLFFLGL